MQQAMRRAGKEVPVVEAQEMADIIAYVIMRRYFETGGDPRAGARLYVAKGCVTCHRLGEVGGEVGPELGSLEGRASPVLMAHVMWKFGPAMLTEMSRVGVPWPSFGGSEMDDLISYLALGDSAPPLDLPIRKD
jgi:cytochrome c2